MEIRINSGIDSVARVASAPAKASRPIDSDAALSAFENSRSLEERLGQLPDVRPEKLDEAKRMAGDPAYPPRETIKRLAVLLAMNDTQSSQE